MASSVHRLLFSAVVLAAAFGLSDWVFAQVSPPLNDQEAPGLVDSSAAGIAAAEPMPPEAAVQPYCVPDGFGCETLCLPEVSPCGDSARLWLRGQYLIWWTKGNPVPALVSTSPAGTSKEEAGVPGKLGFDVLFGDQSIADEDRGGGYITLGYWLDEGRTLGLQVDWFLVGNDKSTGSFAAAWEAIPILARPFYDADSGEPAAARVAFPEVMNGAISVDTSSELNSGDVLLRRTWRSGTRGRIDLLGGYRHFAFREDLTIAESLKLTAAVGDWLQDTTQDSWDHFGTDNDFHGGEFGLNLELYRACWSVNLLAKLALGNVRQELNIDGGTTMVTPAAGGRPSTTYEARGGLLSQPTNIGRHRRNELAVLPELDVNLHYHLTERCSLTLGYTWLRLNRVLRTGDQIDTAVNSRQLFDIEHSRGPLNGAPRPAAIFRDTSLWAQGISFGVQLAR